MNNKILKKNYNKLQTGELKIIFTISTINSLSKMEEISKLFIVKLFSAYRFNKN
jgi:hypothetical protein